LSTFKQRRTHINACTLGFIAAGNDTAIVVAQYHNGLVVQIRSEQAFARTIKTVTINNGKHRVRCSDEK
jgi:meiotically up-regulated gene 157 (Mug157) protein